MTKTGVCGMLLMPFVRGGTGRSAGRIALILSLLSLGTAQVARADAAFDTWVRGFWPEARAAGISAATYNAVFTGMSPDPDTIRLMNRQSEFVKPIWDYLAGAVSDTRVETGKAMLAQYGDVLRAIEQRYGVDRAVVLAVWGMETNYGGFMGKHNVIRALATLAYGAPRRQEFWRSELVTALGIVQAGHIRHDQMIGSWAGAMGHTQFMPSSWKRYAADYNGDGRRDIWTSIPDALASTANYLKEHGWQTGKTWGYEIALPRGFDYGLADDSTTKTLREWQRMGIRRANGRDFPRLDDNAVLVLPAGAAGPAFLMLRNFFVIKRYNNATSYALAVGHLADRIIGGSGFVGDWSREHLPLTREETIELQTALNRKGFHVGEPDGQIGPATRRGIRAYQQARGLIPDGYASVVLLARLKMDS
ncbi:lytic murein transglycosylase [Polymorphum gilvum]|uniref:Lytic murein transglycosylase subfamily, putative n=1 Tax=Polymorphum gilvum (strain LMG 25793 / CGMCC 1.9160 / SL003B-26A1) TaxID=991905 RepID=F2IWH6_POLGS|nr:lytic murein transglycosylase [Polymorphum gilvum]ADZ69275.1 Lytic murein transglycosylase subfamily, putative [Polymorphum gilvum SL003B-26A1]